MSRGGRQRRFSGRLDGESYGSTESQRWTSEELFLDLQAYFERVEQLLQSAKTSIDLEMYIFELDDIGTRVLESLNAAVKRGVRVRVLVDAVGSASSIRSLQERCMASGVDFKVYNNFNYFKRILWMRSFNHRNHRKMWIIDDEIALVGSRNVMNCDWREVDVLVQGPRVDVLQSAFEVVFNEGPRFAAVSESYERLRRRLIRFARKKNLESMPLVLLNDRYSLRRARNRLFLERLRLAKKRIWLSNAYFAPDFRLLRRLQQSAKEGVDVCLLLPKKSDVFFMPWVAATFYYGLLKAGVRVYQYLPSFMHAKVNIVDDWITVGSTNLNHRSLFHDLEVDIRLTHIETQSQIMRAFEADLAKSELVTLQSLKDISLIQKLLARIFLLFTWWI